MHVQFKPSDSAAGEVDRCDDKLNRKSGGKSKSKSDGESESKHGGVLRCAQDEEVKENGEVGEGYSVVSRWYLVQPSRWRMLRCLASGSVRVWAMPWR
jgi:hypothetical protein